MVNETIILSILLYLRTLLVSRLFKRRYNLASHSLKINHLAGQLVLGIGALNFQLGAETAAG